MPEITPAPAPRFELITWWKENNCYNLGVYGLILDAQDKPLSGIIVEVADDEKTFAATSGNDGTYDLYLGSPLDYSDGSDWHLQLKDKGQIVSQKLDWKTSRDCEDGDKIQILRLEWKRKS